MNTTPRVEKSKVIELLEQCSSRGESVPGARTLRRHFGCGSFNANVEEWKEVQAKKWENELKTWAFHSKDLEERVTQAMLQVLNGRVEEVLIALQKQASQDFIMEKKAKEETMAELEEVIRENERLRAELTRERQMREALNQTMIEKVESMAKKCSEEKEELKLVYEEKLHQNQEVSNKLDSLLRQMALRPRGRPRSEPKGN